MSGAGPGTRERLARRVAAEHPDLSYSRAKRAVLDGQVTVDGEVVQNPGALVAAAQRVEFDPARRHVPLPTRRDVEILHADADVAVVVKPAGLLTQPTPAREQDTLVSRVSLALARAAARRPFLAVVHRLDKETSGLVVFATSRRALESLQRQLLDHSLSRLYDAFVEGEVEAPAGSFDRALVGDGVRRRRWVAGPGEAGKPALTHWSVVARFRGATHVRATLETGRTHQIRIHFAAAGHPVLGDRVYGERRHRGAAPGPRVPRLALHAAELGFLHPADGRPLRFECPLPPELERLRRGLAREGKGRPAKGRPGSGEGAGEDVSPAGKAGRSAGSRRSRRPASRSRR